jgi:uncharacterized protein
MADLGWAYLWGTAVQKDYEQGLYWSRKAADAGNTDGMVNLASAYRNGWGVQRNCIQAASLYRKAAEAGNAGAMNDLGHEYMIGKCGVSKDYQQALAWLHKAAEPVMYRR